MVRSMTGYGKASGGAGHKKLSVEIRSLNSKQLDISTKLPWIYREKEIEIRNLISQKLGRGKIDITVSFDVIEDETLPSINYTAIKSYYNQLRKVKDEIGITGNDSDLLAIIMRLPESVRSEKAVLTEEEWLDLRTLLCETLDIVDNYRINEGKSMEENIGSSILKISDCLDSIVPFESERINRIRERITLSIKELPDTVSADSNRLEQELIYYIEKLDINEEKVRLKKHVEYFTETMLLNDACGRTLSFITQEMGREINTIGSKANDASIQRIVVTMKEELEKIKELVQNLL